MPGNVTFAAAESPETSKKPPNKTPATAKGRRTLRPLNLAAAAPGTAQQQLPFFSPGSAAGTPQLFTLRKSLFSTEGLAGEAAPSEGSSSLPGTAEAVAADDRVKVVVRIRPPCDREAGEASCLHHSGVDTLTLLSSPDPTYLTFDHVAGPSSTQHHMFKVVGRPIVDNVIAGYNSTIFAYGQTGSGKTYTMLGELPVADADTVSSDGALPELAGLIPRTFVHLFARIAELEGARRAGREVTFTCSCSLLEIYKEQITDLLSASAKVMLREDKQEGVFMEGLTWHTVASADDVLRLLCRGAVGRHTAATRVNDTSSRSHMVMTCRIESRCVEEGTGVVHRRSKLSLVDLAGSERQKTAETEGDRLKEAQAINKSLFVLGQVINKLTEGSTHIPYRDSKLTLLLRESLGGNSRTVIIPTVSATHSCYFETASTLKFAQRAKLITNRVLVNEDVSQCAVDMAAELQRLRQEVSMLRSLHAAANSSSGGGGGGAGSSASSNEEGMCQALAVSAQLEECNQCLQEQLGRLRRERDSFEAAAKAAKAQVQIMEEAECAAQEHVQAVSSDLQLLQLAYSDAQVQLEQQAVELKALTAEVQQRAQAQEAAVAVLSEQAALLSKVESELELSRAQQSTSKNATKGKLLSADEMAEQIDSLEATMLAVNSQMERLVARNDALLSERNQLKVQVLDLEMRAANSHAVATAAKEQIVELLADKRALQEEAQRLAGAVAENEVAMQALAKRNGELSLELESRRITGNGSLQQLCDLREVVAAMREDLEALEQSKAGAVERATLLEKELQERIAEVGQLQARRAGDQGSAETAARMDSQEAQLRKAKEASMANEAQAAYERRHRILLQKEHAQLMQEHQQLEQRHKELVHSLTSNPDAKEGRAEHSQLVQQLDQARSEVDVLESAVSELRRNHAQQLAELATVGKAAAAWEMEAANLRNQLAEVEEQQRRQHSSVQERMQVAEAKQATLAQELEALEVQGEGTHAKLQAAQAVLAKQEAALAEQEAALADKDALVRGLRADALAAATEVEQLRATIADVHSRLEAELHEHAQRDQDLAAALANKEAALEQLTSQAEDLSQRLQQVQGAAAAAAVEAAQLQEIHDVKCDRLAALEAAAALQQQRVCDLNQQLALARAQAQASKAQADEAQAAVPTLQQRMTVLAAELSDARSKLEVKGGSMESMNRRATELMQEVAANRALIETKDGTIAGLESTVAGLHGQLESAAEHAEQQAQAVSALRHQVAELEEMVAGRHAEARRLALQLETTEEMLAAARQQVADQEAKAAALQTSLDVASAALAAKDSSATELHAAIDRLKEEEACQEAAAAEVQAEQLRTIAELQGRVAVAEQALATTAAEAQRAQQQLEDAKEGLAVRTQQLQAHEFAVAALQEQLGASRHGAEAQAEQLASVTAELVATKGKLEEQIAAAKAGRLQADGLEARTVVLSKELAAAQAKVKEYDAIIIDLEQQLSAAENQLAATKAQLVASEDRVAVLVAEVAAAQQAQADKDKDLEAKEWRIEDLQAAVADLHEEATARATEAEDSAARAAALSVQLEDRTAELEAATLRVQDMNSEAERLKLNADAKDAELQKAASLIADLEAALSAAKHQGAEGAEALAAQAVRVEILEGQLAEKAAHVGRLEEQLSASNAGGEKLERQLTEAQDAAATQAAELAAKQERVAQLEGDVFAAGATAIELAAQLAAAQQGAAAKAAELAEARGQLDSAKERATSLKAQLAKLTVQLEVAEADAAAKQEQCQASEQKLLAAAEAAAASEACIAEMEAQAAAIAEQLEEARQAAKASKAEKNAMIEDHLHLLRGLQEEVATLKEEADKAQREKQVLKEGLFQATADSTEQRAAFIEERAEREEALGVLHAQVAQLQALGAAREHELQMTNSRMQDLQRQLTSTKGEAAAAQEALADVRAELDAVHDRLAASEQESASLRAGHQQLMAQLREEQQGLQQQLDSLAAAAAQKDSTIAALERERDGLRAEQTQLMQAVLEQQAAQDAEAAVGDGCAASTPLQVASATASPAAAPSLDIVRVLRDQKEALKAQHEATLADMREVMDREMGALTRRLATLQRERDDALAQGSFAREEAQRAAADQEVAAAAARSAQAQLQRERDAVMRSLAELQAAFTAAETKRGAEMRRLRQVAEAGQAEACSLQAQLEQRKAELRSIIRQQQQQQPCTAAIDKAAVKAALQAVNKAVPLVRAPVPVQPSEHQQQPPQQQQAAVAVAQLPAAAAARGGAQPQQYADMEGADMVVQSSPSGSLRSSVGEPLPLQPLKATGQDNVATARAMPPPQLQSDGGGSTSGWGAGYEKAFQDDGLTQDSSSKPRGGSHQRGGFLSSLSNQRIRVSSDENNRGVAVPLRGGHRVHLPQLQRYSRLTEGPGSS